MVLADFGLAKDMTNLSHTQTFCGTPEYFAPELLQEAGHNHQVDWWAIGVLIYEMVIGFPPFYNKIQKKMFELIVNSPPKFPDAERHGIAVSDELIDLIKGLLAKNPEYRLGAGGVAEITSHPWFADIDQEALLKKEIEMPWKPSLSEDLEELSGFDPDAQKLSLTEESPTEGELNKVREREDVFKLFDM